MDAAAGFANLNFCRALAPRPRLSNRRAVFGDVIRDENAGSSTDACLTDPAVDADASKPMDVATTNAAVTQWTNTLATCINGFTHAKKLPHRDFLRTNLRRVAT